MPGGVAQHLTHGESSETKSARLRPESSYEERFPPSRSNPGIKRIRAVSLLILSTLVALTSGTETWREANESVVPRGGDRKYLVLCCDYAP